MSTNAVSSLIFAFRNVDKTKNGEIGRAPVAMAQGVKVVQSALEKASVYNENIAKGTEAATKVVTELSKESKVVNGVVKATDWATKNVNPLICVSGGIKVLMSDDKPKAAIRETSAIATMFAGERAAKLALAKLPIGGVKGTIIKGLLFVGASIASYSIGEKLGNHLADEIRVDSSFKDGKIDQMA